MFRHMILILVISAAALLLMFLPFMPGDHDASAAAFSTIIQMAGLTGLVLVPIGLVWLVYEWVGGQSKSAGVRRGFKLASLAASCVLLLGAGVAGFINGLVLGVIILVGGSYVIYRGFRRALRPVEPKAQVWPVPVYMIALPTIIVLARIFFLAPAVEYSRSRVIENAAPMIRDIEAYRERNGRYPISLQSLWNDYDPGVRNVDRYHYEPSGDAYNLYFKQFSAEFGLEEIVMYNKLDEQQMTSHDEDLLRVAPEALGAQRGYFAVHRLPQAHWKAFWFD